MLRLRDGKPVRTPDGEREPYPSEKQERFIIRLPDGMRDQIRESAAKNNRSMNAEVVHALEYYFDELNTLRIDTGPELSEAEIEAEIFSDFSHPVPAHVREAMQKVVKEIQDDVSRRLNEWLWLHPEDTEEPPEPSPDAD